MTLFGTLFSGASGLTAQSRSLGMISDNVANVNTVGYKGAAAQFASLVTRQANVLTYAPGGVRAVTSYSVTKQGLVQGTDSPTDAAISGNGFFVVNARADSSGEQLYTRNGSFVPDHLGNLRTASGFYLQGWALDADEEIIDINSLETVNIRSISGVATATTRVEIGANLDSTTAAFTGTYAAGDMEDYAFSSGGSGVRPHFRRDLRVYDSLGEAHTLTLAFLKTAENEWAVELYGSRSDLDSPPHLTGLLASGTLTFNGDGSLAAVTGSIGSAVTIDWDNGAENSEIAFDLGTAGQTDGLTQFATAADVAFVQQNGAEVGQLSRVSIDEQGYVVASFTNGAQRRIYRLPIATFANPSGLDPRSGNVFAETDASGEYNLRFPERGGAGRITPSALEMANVDLADEFTRMIVTQRAYTANARVITTVNDMLDELMQISR